MSVDLKYPGSRRGEVAEVLQTYMDEGAFAEAKEAVIAAASAVSDAFEGPVGAVIAVVGRGPDGAPRRQLVGDANDPQSIARMGDITAFHDDLILDGGNF